MHRGAAISPTYTNLVIKLGQTSATSLPTGGFYTGTLTTVYTQASVTLPSTSVGSWLAITLQTQFLYDPTQSLVMDIQQCGLSGTGIGVGTTTLTGFRRTYQTPSACSPVYVGQDALLANCGITVIPATPCSTPADQPTALNLSVIGTTQINGSFTAANSSPTNYLVVRYLHGATPTNPANQTTYIVGGLLGSGTVLSVSSSTSFNATGLSPGTQYDFYVYSYNSITGNCSPAYNTTSPLYNSATTQACGGWSGTRSLGPSGY